MQNEFRLIEKIKNMFAPLVTGDLQGIGDDCAVIPSPGGESLVVTTDMLIEDVHFLRTSTSAFELGGKALAVNLSDIAAMGARPVASFLSLGLPAGLGEDWCDDFMEGYRDMSLRYSTPLLGGDTTSSPEKIVINVAVIGRAAPENIKLRSGAKPGQKICVTGVLGDSATGLKLLQQSARQHVLIQRHNNPLPHLEAGLELGKIPGVGAMTDVSDGIASDLLHILQASGVAAEIELSALPLSPEMRQACAENGWDAAEIAVSGGEDYVLLFTADADSCAGYDVIGEITEGEPAITWKMRGVKTNARYEGFSHKI